jgi:hypothetical protein
MNMKAQTGTEDSGYSPPISIELHLHGERFNVASVGPDNAILRDARPMQSGTGVIHFDVDGSVVLYQVNLFNGIDPQVDEQPFVLISVQSEVAA